jgi:hypothetical protein
VVALVIIVKTTKISIMVVLVSFYYTITHRRKKCQKH